MRVLFRVDASYEIGTGHVTRCLAIAQELKAKGDHADFYSLPHPGNLNSMLEAEGFRVVQKPDQSYDVCVIDHYHLTRSEETHLRNYSKKIVVIDDWTDRIHDADLIVDPSISSRSELRERVNQPTRFLSGADWLFLRSDFRSLKTQVKPRTEFKNVLLFFGGTDPKDLSWAYYQAIRNQSTSDFNYHFLIGNSHPRKQEFEKLPRDPKISFHFSPSSVAEFMATMDLYLGSAGTISWERMCLGLTGLVISIIENQEDNARTLERLGFHHYLGTDTDVSAESALAQLSDYAKDPKALSDLSRRCYEAVDGRATERFIVELMRLVNEA